LEDLVFLAMITSETQEKSFVICIMTTHSKSWRPTGGNVLIINTREACFLNCTLFVYWYKFL